MVSVPSTATAADPAGCLIATGPHNKKTASATCSSWSRRQSWHEHPLRKSIQAQGLERPLGSNPHNAPTVPEPPAVEGEHTQPIPCSASVTMLSRSVRRHRRAGGHGGVRLYCSPSSRSDTRTCLCAHGRGEPGEGRGTNTKYGALILLLLRGVRVRRSQPAAGEGTYDSSSVNGLARSPSGSIAGGQHPPGRD